MSSSAGKSSSSGSRSSDAAVTTTQVRKVAVNVTANTLRDWRAEAADDESQAALDAAVELLRRDEAVAFPTETVYGLGANALRSAAAARIYAAKNRPADNPLIVHVSSLAMIDEFAELPAAALPLAERFWPGPLTLLLRKKPGCVPDNVTCGLDTVGVRMPVHPVARKLIELAGFPIAAPSANRSGRPSPTMAEHVRFDLDGRIQLILDGGQADVGVESTVLDLLSMPPALLRPGGVTYEQLVPLLPTLRVYKKDFVSTALEQRPTTPGMKYRHYSPDAKVVLFEPMASTAMSLQDAVNREIAAVQTLGLSCAVVRTSAIPMTFAASLKPFQQGAVAGKSDAIEYVLSASAQADEVAHGLFKALRDLDEVGVDVILVEGITEDKEGLAVMNRLRKAAAEVVHFS